MCYNTRIERGRIPVALKMRIVALLLLLSMALSGCVLRTLEELYCLPKRSEDYEKLQSLIDEAMEELTYSAPISGDNRQSVQTADLDGDGIDEHLLFAKDESENPLKILIFSQVASGYVLMDTIEGYGFAFDFVQYAQIDDKPGLEIVVGRQVSEDLPRSVSVYRFASGYARQMLSTGYTGLACEDLDNDGMDELMLFTAGVSDRGNGMAVLYTYEEELLHRSVVSHLSRPIAYFQQVKTGLLQDGSPAVFVTSAENDQGLLLDIFAFSDNALTNLTEGTYIPAVRNYFLYPEDIDDDGVVEIPCPVVVQSSENAKQEEYILQWESVDKNGLKTTKGYTYHHFVGSWYLRLERSWIDSLAIVQENTGCGFFLIDPETGAFQKLLVIHAFTGSDRENENLLKGRVLLFKGDSIVFAAELGEMASACGITEANVQEFFTLIRKEWNTEEDGDQ